MDNNNNSQNTNKNDLLLVSKASPASTANNTAASTAASLHTPLNDLNLVGVTWSVPNIRRQFEAKNAMVTTAVAKQAVRPVHLPAEEAILHTARAKLVNIHATDQANHSLPSHPPAQPLHHVQHHNTSNIYHFFKDVNGNPTTYI